MTYYIKSTDKSIAVDDREYATLAEAIEAFRAPSYVGAAPKEITMTGERTFKVWGYYYEVVEGSNPKAPRATAVAAVAKVSVAERPTVKQIALMRKLLTKASGGSLSVRANMAIRGELSRKAASRLIDEMITEAKWA